MPLTRGGTLNRSTTYDLSDRLGTATKQTNSSTTTTATRTYDAFGMTLATTGTPLGPFGFAGASGYQEDGDTGLKLLGHRYYDASTGRFLTRDPIKDGRNWYGYVGNNPLRAVDPTGLWNIWQSAKNIAIGAVVIVAVAVFVPITAPVWGGIAVGAGTGAIVGAVQGANNYYYDHRDKDDWDNGQLGVNTAVGAGEGAAIGGASGGVGQAGRLPIVAQRAADKGVREFLKLLEDLKR